MKAPPLLPGETFHRVVRVANLDGMSVMAVAGFITLAAASVGGYRGAGIGLLVAAAGAFELHGVGLLRAGRAHGMKWILASQPYLLTVMLGYCALRLSTYDPALLQTVISDEQRLVIEQAGYGEEEFLRNVHDLSYYLLAIGTLLYQGGMTIYYLRRSDAVVAAVESGEAFELVEEG